MEISFEQYDALFVSLTIMMLMVISFIACKCGFTLLLHRTEKDVRKTLVNGITSAGWMIVFILWTCYIGIMINNFYDARLSHFAYDICNEYQIENSENRDVVIDMCNGRKDSEMILPNAEPVESVNDDGNIVTTDTQYMLKFHYEKHTENGITSRTEANIEVFKLEQSDDSEQIYIPIS